MIGEEALLFILKGVYVIAIVQITNFAFMAALQVNALFSEHLSTCKCIYTYISAQISREDFIQSKNGFNRLESLVH